ncbi:hypothetical protein HAX54_007227 [Datura stramonium]|uniref:Uncharacterized protein n=1 Tax=Datura stramonium TaxID=4076 RepID=A0ABS8RUX8_DATST|nr:hypothetical protein [Datura stramonium]
MAMDKYWVEALGAFESITTSRPFYSFVYTYPFSKVIGDPIDYVINLFCDTFQLSMVQLGPGVWRTISSLHVLSATANVLAVEIFHRLLKGLQIEALKIQWELASNERERHRGDAFHWFNKAEALRRRMLSKMALLRTFMKRESSRCTNEIQILKDVSAGYLYFDKDIAKSQVLVDLTDRLDLDDGDLDDGGYTLYYAFCILIFDPSIISGIWVLQASNEGKVRTVDEAKGESDGIFVTQPLSFPVVLGSEFSLTSTMCSTM